MTVGVSVEIRRPQPAGSLPINLIGAAGTSPVRTPAIHYRQTALAGARGRRDGCRVVSAGNADRERARKIAKTLGPIDGAIEGESRCAADASKKRRANFGDPSCVAGDGPGPLPRGASARSPAHCRSARRAPTANHAAGLMFWFTRKTLSGSYRCFSDARRG